jgi:hypothetical protein
MSQRPSSWCAYLSILLILHSLAPAAAAFTQSGAYVGWFGSGVPVGHEWLTRRAFFELSGPDPHYPNTDKNDPRNSWTQGKAKNLDISSSGAQAELARIKSVPKSDTRYYSGYDLVYSVIIGNRWVDIGGFNVTTAKLGAYDCFNGVAQDPGAVQYDHYLRGFNDNGDAAAADAAGAANQRFINYFVAAATAPPQRILVWDGGGSSSLQEVDYNYFLLGRAAHLLQDSFSSEHTVRSSADTYVQLRQVKSYVCTLGSEQHPHANPSSFAYSLGDVVWKNGTALGSTSSYIASNMKPTALSALEASKDLWAAWIRTMGTPAASRAGVANTEAFNLVLNWMSFSRDAMSTWYASNPANSTYVNNDPNATGAGSQRQCVKNTFGISSGNLSDWITQTQTNQRVCLYNVLPAINYGDLWDPAMQMPFNWQWRSSGYTTPPQGWTIPQTTADSGAFITLVNLGVGSPITWDGPGSYIKVIPSGGTPLQLKQLPGLLTNGYVFRVRYNPSMFLMQNRAMDPDTFGQILLASPASEMVVKPGPGNASITSGPVVFEDYFSVASNNPSSAVYLCAAGTGFVFLNGTCNNLNNPLSQWNVVPASP